MDAIPTGQVMLLSASVLTLSETTYNHPVIYLLIESLTQKQSKEVEILLKHKQSHIIAPKYRDYIMCYQGNIP